MKADYITSDRIKIPPSNIDDFDVLIRLEDRLSCAGSSQWDKARILGALHNVITGLGAPRLPLPPGGVGSPIARFARLFPDGVEGVNNNQATIADLLQTYELVVAARPLLDDLAGKHGGEQRLLAVSGSKMWVSAGAPDLQSQADVVRIGLNHLTHAIVFHSLYGEAGRDDARKFEAYYRDHESNAASIFFAAHLVKMFAERVAPKAEARANFSLIH